MQWLTIAAGTEFETAVLDARGDFAWAIRSGSHPAVPPRALVFHHSAVDLRAGTVAGQRTILEANAKNDRFGVPYNFVIFPGTHKRIWYLNDVDQNWPHTYGWNDATAICLWGNWDTQEPPRSLIARAGRLARALEAMWGKSLPRIAHRDVYPTVCPGQHAFDALLQAGILEK